MTKYKLDQEEQNILELFENKKLKRSNNVNHNKQIAQKAATKHMRKDARVNIRISSFDLDRIRRIAANEGIPYQTMISSILHKYAKNFFGDKA